MTCEQINSRDVRPWRSLNWPNRISILRLLLVAPFVMLLVYQREWPWCRYAAFAIFVVMGISDAVDGFLARRLKARTRLGALLDPLADKALIICAVITLSLPQWAVPGHRLPNWLVVAVVAKDLWVIFGFIVVYLVTDRIRIRPTTAGKACTFGQLWLVGLTLLAPDLDRAAGPLGMWAVAVVSWIVVGLCCLAMISYTRLGLKFVAVEQKPLDDNHNQTREAGNDAD